MGWSEWKTLGGTPIKHPETLTSSNYGTVSITHPKMAILYTNAQPNYYAPIVIVNKTILLQNSNTERVMGMGFNYDATTDTLTLTNVDIGGRQFELYYVN